MSGFLLLELVLHELCFNLEVRQLFSKTLGLDAQRFTFLLNLLHLTLHNDASFNRLVIFGFHVLQRRCSIACLTLKIIVGNFGVS